MGEVGPATAGRDHAHRESTAPITRRPDSPLWRLPKGGLKGAATVAASTIVLPGPGMPAHCPPWSSSAIRTRSPGVRQLGPESAVLRRCGGPAARRSRTFTHAQTLRRPSDRPRRRRAARPRPRSGCRRRARCRPPCRRSPPPTTPPCWGGIGTPAVSADSGRASRVHTGPSSTSRMPAYTRFGREVPELAARDVHVAGPERAALGREARAVEPDEGQRLAALALRRRVATPDEGEALEVQGGDERVAEAPDRLPGPP